MATDIEPGALRGVRVIEMGQPIAGPFAAKTLSDFGADVIKIEPPDTGDPLRKTAVTLSRTVSRAATVELLRDLLRNGPMPSLCIFERVQERGISVERFGA